MTSKASWSRVRALWKKEIRPLLVFALALFAVRSSLADWNDVPTGSMKPTILEGDRVFVNKLAYDLKVPFTTWHLAEWKDPQRGEIVVFFSPYDGVRLVKRVIGVPGDRIELRNDVLILNGEEVRYSPSQRNSWEMSALRIARLILSTGKSFQARPIRSPVGLQ
jgi:signal peptidase I